MSDQSMFIPSPYSFLPEVTNNLTPPEKVEILDLTLDEDGEGMSGAHLTGEQKVKVAGMLDEIGVSRIGVLGFPTYNLPEEMALLRNEVEIAKEVASVVKHAKLCTLVNEREDIDRALEVGVWGVQIRRLVNHLVDIPFESKEQKIKDVVDLGIYAKSNGLHVSWMAQDIIRTDPNNGELKELLCSVQDQFDLDEICLADSYGVGNPFGFQFLVRMVKNWMGIPIQVHCHDHLGMGAANSCAAVAAGASVVHTTVNGLGHFSGMTALEEVGVALKIGFGIDCGILYNNLFAISKTVQEFTGIKMPPHKPVVGDRAFVLSEDIKYIKQSIERKKAGMPTINSLPYKPEFVGNRHGVVMAHKISRLAVEYNLNEAGYNLPDHQVDEIYKQVKEFIDKEQRVIEDTEFQAIVDRTISLK